MTQTSKLQDRFTTAATAAEIVATTVDLLTGTIQNDPALMAEAQTYADAASLLAKFDAEFGDAVRLDTVATKLARRAQRSENKRVKIAGQNPDVEVQLAAATATYMRCASDVARAFKRNAAS